MSKQTNPVPSRRNEEIAMSKLTNPVPSRESIRRGRDAVEHEIAVAVESAEDAALASAINPTEENRGSLQAAQGRVAGLRAELDGLTALAAAAGRHEAAQARLGRIDELRRQEQRTLALVSAFRSKFDSATESLRSFAVKYREMEVALEGARASVIAANSEAIMTSMLPSAKRLIQELVLIELGDALSIVGCLQRTPEDIATSLERMDSQARWLVQSGVAAKIEAVEAVGRPQTTPAEAEEAYVPARPAVHALPGNPGVQYVVGSR